jgi:hypothetical protein
MTDLDTLRRALRAQQDLGPDGRATSDLGDIMARGRRLRLRRRLTAAGGVVCAVAVVFGVVLGIGQFTRPSPVPAQGPAGSIRTVHPPSPRHTHVSTPAPAPTPSGPAVARPTGSATPSPSVGPSNPMLTPSQGASLVPTPGRAAGSVPTATPSQGSTSSAPVATPGNGAGPTAPPSPSG